jgi:hypothetical protein
MSCRQRHDSFTPDVEEWIGAEHERADPLSRNRREGRVDFGIRRGSQYQCLLSDCARCLPHVFQLDLGIRVIWIQQHGDHRLRNEFAQKS